MATRETRALHPRCGGCDWVRFLAVALRRMQVTDLRCLHHADIDFDPAFTLISGSNASGKTSLLEAIYVLGRGRSFRTRHLQHLIRSGAERMVVFGEVELQGRRLTLGVEAAAKTDPSGTYASYAPRAGAADERPSSTGSAGMRAPGIAASDAGVPGPTGDSAQDVPTDSDIPEERVTATVARSLGAGTDVAGVRGAGAADPGQLDIRNPGTGMPGVRALGARTLTVRAKLAGERVASLAELATVLPVQIIDPEVHRLIEEGPSRRRRFLDWGVFHVEQAFIGHWQKYTQALRQRNAALRRRQPASSVSAWDAELVRHGEQVTEARRRYVARIEPIAQESARKLLGLELSLGYRTGWARELSFKEALARSLPKDLEFGVTQNGPQRAELVIRLSGVAAKDRISRGQQKLLAAALLISQIKLFPEDSPVRPTLLLDDPAAELDGERLSALIEEVRAQSLQLVVTTLHGGLAEFSAFGRPGRRYRLEQGTLHAEG